ncbi:excinuclease ABC subunit B [Candidatus Nomurabacteria bacterium RIFCSPLOWO2_12_FULL_46_14]|uniref:UvrABC system protein B n=1 Tax=Candidatus Nomurabacteria bacterium RIFCSPLOWO2_12_FULL_46_14 TaxID=1801797 RepID=A0A1F6Y8Y9_9BACT|nr:MAG: excinuclease ABC subunit B [Candidatus Nomurabacteria bacterium RIFCSPLOWO2_12_FULL_46_14]
MAKSIFKLHTPFAPAGDQPVAISKLAAGLKKGIQRQTLLGATGTGKTFTIANVIAEYNKPTLVIAHNKTLAAQLAQEFREFFPEAAVHYFVSYYDYYQPEAYMPASDTYIEKDAQINKEIDRLRHATTQALLTRRDVIIVASVSCIYGLGSPDEYEKVNLKLEVGMKMDRFNLIKSLIKIHFERTNADLQPGSFRSIGSRVEFMPVSETFMYQVEISAGTISKIMKVDPVSSSILKEERNLFIFPTKHFITEESRLKVALGAIRQELREQLKKFAKEGKLLEAERLKRRTRYDLAMMKEVGYCNGIENYSRHLSGKPEGKPPDTLLSYFPKMSPMSDLGDFPLSPTWGTESPDFLTIIDESHVTLPQLRGMYAGDASRKSTLVEYGFRLPSAKDNRPLKYEEFEKRIGSVIYISATPGEQERIQSGQIVEQIIRPTGLVDPETIVRGVAENGKYKGQIFDFIEEAEKTIKNGFRVLATTLTKKMAEDLSTYLKDLPAQAGKKIKAEYLHSDIKTMERIKILTQFRKGEFNVLVGVNLLREGLDLPEVALIGILDADREGFLRSETSLIQTIGRAARNSEGRVILYADVLTGSMKKALSETVRRRNIQLAYNKKHGITPKTINKKIKDITEELESEHGRAVNFELALDLEVFLKNPAKLIKQKEKEMNKAVKELDFESAAILRDEMVVLRNKIAEKTKSN